MRGIQLPPSVCFGGNFLIGNGCSSAIREKQIDFLMKFHFSFLSALPLCNPYLQSLSHSLPLSLSHTHTRARMANCAETLCGAVISPKTTGYAEPCRHSDAVSQSYHPHPRARTHTRTDTQMCTYTAAYPPKQNAEVDFTLRDTGGGRETRRDGNIRRKMKEEEDGRSITNGFR